MIRSLRFFIVLIPVVFMMSSSAFCKVLTGVVLDRETGAPISGAFVEIMVNHAQIVTDHSGQFEINVSTGTNVSLRISKPGYAYIEYKGMFPFSNVHQDQTLVFELNPVKFETEINVKADKFELKFQDVNAREIEVSEIENHPGGIDDPVRKMKVLPGVVSENDFTSLLYIRGGNFDETMLILDRAYLLNPYHLGGAFSVYMEDLVDYVEFYPGGFPAQYGNALSAILDVHYRHGNFHTYGGTAEISPINSKFLYEGPVGGSGSFIVSGRRSYWELIADAFGLDEKYAAPYYGDFFGKYSLQTAHRRISLETIYGQDGVKRFELDEPLENPNADPGTFYYLNESILSNLSWEEWISPIWNSVATLAFSHTDTEADLTGTEPLNADASIAFVMGDWIVNCNRGNWKYASGVQIGWGDIDLDSLLSDFRTSIPGARRPGNTNLAKSEIDFQKSIQFQSGWTEMEWSGEGVMRKQIGLGLRGDHWQLTNEWTFSPRIDFLFGLNPHFNVTGAAGIYHQFPYDVLKISENFGNPDLKSERAYHVNVGIEGHPIPWFKVRGEVFFKQYERIIVNHDTKEAAEAAFLRGEPFVNDGEGYAYGGELFCQLFENTRWSGWLAYSYIVTKMRNPLHRENPEWYYPLQDQRHTVHLVAGYRPYKRWYLSAKISGSSGRPTTPVTGWHLELDSDSLHLPVWVAEYGSLNSDRLPDYFRMDLRCEYSRTFQRIGITTFLEILNVTNQDNLYVYSYNTGDPPHRKPLKEKVYNLPLVPVAGIKISF